VRSLVLLLVPTLAFAQKYDPDADRTALRNAATASYDETVRAAGLPLEPEKAAQIKAGLDEGVRQARLAEEAAKSIETAALKRADEMAAIVAGRGGPAPETAAKDYGAAGWTQRQRWTKATDDQTDLKKRVDALPDKKDDGSTNSAKKEIKDLLARAAAALGDADNALKIAEPAATTMADGAARMKSAQMASLGPADERAGFDSKVVDGAEALPAPVTEAKGRVDMLGQEPREQNKALAWQKLDPLRDRTREIFGAADRACNRADDFHNRSRDFDRAFADFDGAKKAGDGAPAAAAAALDKAEKAQADAHDRLDHPHP
jgi:hypothetical protein